MKIIRLHQTLERTGDTRSPLYDKISRGLFTRPVKLGGARAAGWPEHEIEAIVAARVAGAPDIAIRQLVAQLHESRATMWRDIANTWLPQHVNAEPRGESK